MQHGPKSSLVDARHAVLELAGELQNVDIRTFEALELDAQVQRVLPVASSILAQGCDLVGFILTLCEQPRSDTLPPNLSFELTMDAAVEQSRSGVVDVGDIAFCAHLELRQRRQRLAEVVSSPDALTLLSECDGALRRLYKALCALDTALAGATGGEPWLDFTPELERSLRVRRYYARLRQKILVEIPANCPGLLARLRGVGTSIAILVGLPVYAELRVGDRLQLRALQSRLLAWMRGSQESVAQTSGLELWSDVKAFVAMLEQVNRRQELVDHDATVLREAKQYAQQHGETAFPLSLRGRLDLLLGLDHELDQLLRGAERPSLAWLEVLETLDSGGNCQE